jgi:hypothetical protein
MECLHLFVAYSFYLLLYIQSARSTQLFNLANVELDDITLLEDKFQIIIDRIRKTGICSP